MYPFLSKPPCPTILPCRRTHLLTSYKNILEKIHHRNLPSKLELKLKYLERLNERYKMNMICLLLISDDLIQFIWAIRAWCDKYFGDSRIGLCLASQHLIPGALLLLLVCNSIASILPCLRLLQITEDQACAALTRIPNVNYTTITRDLATWVFTLANSSVR